MAQQLDFRLRPGIAGVVEVDPLAEGAVEAVGGVAFPRLTYQSL
jgi:hypothetical protein